MKALVLECFNEPFKFREIPEPFPAKGEVLVRIAASGVNPLDIKIRKGKASHSQTQLPAILGVDMSGVVEAVGDGESKFKVGDEVYGFVGGVGGIPGTLAEYVVADADLLAFKPKNLSFHDAASVPLAFITAWEALVYQADVKKGDQVLIHGGSGGVGNFAIQIAKAKGATVFSTVKRNKFELISGYGGIPIDYENENPENYTLELTDGNCFDVVLDTVGGKVLDSSFESVRPCSGHVVSILGWGTHSLAPLSFRNGTYSGVFTLYPLLSGKGRARYGDILSIATDLIEKGHVKPFVSQSSFGFETIMDAYHAVETGSDRGKVVIDIIR